MHELLGLAPTAPFQSLYHFTVGRAIMDKRIRDIRPYQHLQALRQSKQRPPYHIGGGINV